MSTLSFQRTFSVARKEVLHIRRDPGALFFALFIPILEMFMLGYAIDMNVRNIRTVVLDRARTQETSEVLRAFVNSDDFRIVRQARDDDDLYNALVAGEAQVGILIPEEFSRRLQAGQTAQVLVLVDGSISTVAAEAVNVSNAIALRMSLALALEDRPLPVETRPRVLFNPDTRSANFFIPGLMVVMCQMLATMLTSNAIVREKENGTLEQLFMTPVRPTELMLGKLAPYLVLTFLELCMIAFLMRTVFQVPIHGRFVTFLVIAFPFIAGMLGMGLWISARAKTRDEAMHMTFGTLMPCIFLSGYIFPVDSMPVVFQYIAYMIPTTWLIDAARGVILRGAGWAELWQHAVVLSGMAVAIIAMSIASFHKRAA